MTITNGICQSCARDYRDPASGHHIETGPCLSDDCPSHELNKSPPQYSPAPWRLFEAGEGIRNSHAFDETTIVDADGHEVLGTSEWLRAKSADLILMTAAPEMLEILSSIRNFIRSAANQGIDHRISILNLAGEHLDSIEAVIAKARGQA